jgi:hypothetical protein
LLQRYFSLSLSFSFSFSLSPSPSLVKLIFSNRFRQKNRRLFVPTAEEDFRDMRNN